MKYDSVYMGINDDKAMQVPIYPNPASTNITIEIPTKCSLSILTISGQELLQKEIIEPIVTIDISTLTSGIYFVKLTGERSVRVGKIIKQ
jgi:hypothetical protein